MEFLQHEPEDFEGMEVGQLQGLLLFRCSESDSQQLLRPVSPKVIKDVMFAMPNNKSGLTVLTLNSISLFGR